MGVEGFVLVGGQSSRFGSDKALALWKGHPLLHHAVRVLREAGLTPRLVGRDPRPYAGFSHAFVLAERAGLGPVEGLRAALRASAAPRALVLSVDMPAVTVEGIRALLAEAGDRPACFHDAERWHPFPGAYPRTALDVLESLPPGSSMQAALERLQARAVDPGRIPGHPDPASILWNVNRRHDLQRPDAGENPIDTPGGRS